MIEVIGVVLVAGLFVIGPRVTRRQRCVADHGMVKAPGSSTVMEICTVLPPSINFQRSTT